jgi:REP-associated tyrosine transposase
MPRQARIDITGLLQHVIVRGVARSDIFLDDDDREDFVQRFSGLLMETGTRCYAWTLLDNHVHLLLYPTEQPLRVLMRRLLTGYAVTFNLKHGRSGHLFQNRYKSIVCDRDVYLLELIRYIHLNPLRAGIVDGLESLGQYRWCGHRQLAVGKGFTLLPRDELLALFAKKEREAVSRYLAFLDDGLAKTHNKLSRGGRRISRALNRDLRDNDLFDDRILGGGAFVAQVLSEAELGSFQGVTLEQLISLIAEHYGLTSVELTWPSKVPTIVRAKAIISHLAMRCCYHSGAMVAAKLGYSSSAVSRAALRGRVLFESDPEIQQLWKNVEI